MLDPVRFISNVSTGYMGYALAEEALSRGHKVTLVSGPTALKPPQKAAFFAIVSAQDLKDKCEEIFDGHDVLVMVAAVCDFTAERKEVHKIRRITKKSLHLKQTPDIVAGLAKNKGDRLVIGFCLETRDWLKNAKEKLKRKHLDGIVANYYGNGHVPFGPKKINTAFLSGNDIFYLKNKPKKEISIELLKWIEGLQKKKFLHRQN